MCPRVEFDEANHIYRVNGRVVPSVTQLLPKSEYLQNMDPERLSELADEGKANHAAVEEFLHTRKATCGYLEGVEKFLADYDRELGNLVAAERAMGSIRGFAGTADMIFEHAIVDLKRSFGDRKIHALQTAGYNFLAVENALTRPVKKHYILVSHDDGTYEAVNVYNDRAEVIFLGLVSKWHIEANIQNYFRGV